MTGEFYDQTTPQIFVLSFYDDTTGCNVLLSTNGDFTTDPITINRPFYTDQNLTVGGTPSATFACTLQNDDGRFNDFPFGEARSFIGYLSADEAAQALAVENASGTTSYITNDTSNGVVIDGDPILSDPIYGAVIRQEYPGDTYIYYIDDNTGHLMKVNVEDQQGDYTDLGTPNAFFLSYAENHPGRLTYLLYGDEYTSANELCVWEDEEQQTYTLVPTGVFEINKPRSTHISTIGISDVLDRMSLFDVPSEDFISTEKSKYYSKYSDYRCYAGELFDDVVDTINSALAPYRPTSWDSVELRLDYINDNYYTYRQLLALVMEAVCYTAFMDGAGVLDFKSPPSTQDTAVYTFDETVIVAEGYDRADLITEQIQGVVLYKANNTVWMSGGSSLTDNNYVINDNPLMDENTVQDASWVSTIQHVPQYHPVEVDFTELSPVVLNRPGSIVSIINPNTSTYEDVPMWEIGIEWCGKTYGTITAGGEEKRINL